MIKKFLSTFLAIAIVMTMFVFPASAEETFTISMPNGTENYIAFSSTYSPYTLEGTEMIVRPDVTLKDGQYIAYYMNDVEVGSSASADDFAFSSVYGANNMQAKIFENGEVVAESNVITKNFTQLIHEKDLYTNNMSSWTNMYQSSGSAWTTFVTDPLDANGATVMKVKKPDSDVGVREYQIKVKSNDDFYAKDGSDTGSGITKVDYKIYVANTSGKIKIGGIWTNKINASSDSENRKQYDGMLVIDEPNGAVTGNLKDRSMTVNSAAGWVDVQYIFDADNDTLDITVGNVQVTGQYAVDSDHYLQTVKLATPYSKEFTGEYYIRDVKVARYKPAGVTITPACGDKPVVAGTKVMINADSTYEGTESYVYYCNGVRYTDNKVKASAGTNTVYAEALDSNGRLLGKSKAVTFDAYADHFNASYTEKNISTSGWDTSPGDLGRYKTQPSGNRLWYISVDVTPKLVGDSSWGFKTTFQVAKDSNGTGAEIAPRFFRFYSSYIQVYTTVGGNGGTGDSYISVPYEQGVDTYKVTTVFNPLNDTYIQLVNDVVYSVIDASGGSVDKTPTNKNYTYLDCDKVPVSTVEGQTNTITLSNLEKGYTELPVNHSAIEYIYDAEFVTTTNELTSSDDIEVRFAAIKGDYTNVFCIATVLETNGELVSLATKDVDFLSKDTETVSLKLENLPADIENGGYTVNVMLWNKDDLKPIVTKIVMPRN